MKFIRALKPLFCEDRLRKVGHFNLEKSRLCGNLIAPSSICRGFAGKPKRFSSPGTLVTGQGVMVQSEK